MILRRPCSSTRRQAGKGETARVTTSSRELGGRASGSVSVSNKDVAKKTGTRSCIAVFKGNKVEDGMKRSNKAAPSIWKGDGVTTRSAQANEGMKLRSKSEKVMRRKVPCSHCII